MNDEFRPSQASLNEALVLSEQIIENIELSQLPLSNIALKSARQARILGDLVSEKIFRLEVSGYPVGVNGIVPNDVWELGVIAGRNFQVKDGEEIKPKIYLEPISVLEELLEMGQVSLSAAKDADVSKSSANPKQYLVTRSTNRAERIGLRRNLITASERPASRISYLHNYALKKYYELKYSDISEDIFTRKRALTDSLVSKLVADAVEKFISVQKNLESDNREDWSNAVRSCRKILQDLADKLYPPRAAIEKTVDGEKRKIKLGKSHYKNRLLGYIEENSESDRFREIVGSHLSFIDDRLDSAFQATQKGSHATIVSREEAERYVIYTYMLVGDILSLNQGAKS